MKLFRILCVCALLAPLVSCDEVAETSSAAATSSKRVVYEAKEKWKDLLTYSPSKGKPSQLPQTRYCYRMQTDIVCYDSAQADVGAPMVGYQDGRNISWFQPGGGSVGFSGGPATADLNYPRESPPQINAPASETLAAPVTTATAPSPQAGEIDVKVSSAPFKPQVK